MINSIKIKTLVFSSFLLFIGALALSFNQPYKNNDLNWVKQWDQPFNLAPIAPNREIHPSILELLATQTNASNGANSILKVSLISHSGFLSAMSPRHHIPAWVNYQVSAKELIHPGNYKRTSGYPSDEQYPWIEKKNYSNSGYDHGHMAPARDLKHDPKLYRETNLMTNIAPQHACLNQKGWCMIETLLREWTIQDKNTSLYVSSGSLLNPRYPSLFIDSLVANDGRSIMVPSYYFKAFCIWNKSTNKAIGGGFLVPNSNVENTEVRSMLLTINELEYVTGLDFFYTWPKYIETEMEAQLPNLPFNIKSDCGIQQCDKIYSQRPKPKQ